MDSAPWYGLSGAAHLLAFFVLSAFPWSSLRQDSPPLIVVSMTDPIDIIEDDPIEPLDPIELPDEPIDDPVISDATLVDADTDEDVNSDDFAPSDVFSLVRSDFTGQEGNQEIGVGGGAAGGGINGRGLGRQGLGKRGGKPIEDALENALEWLARHQSPDGSWDSDGFDAECGATGNTICDGPGRAGHDVGVTGLVLLAFLGEGGVPGEGRYGDVLSKGIFWLRGQQDPDTGLLGDASTHEYLYNHAIGSLALCEAYYASNSPRLKRPAQSAIHYINRARNPYSAWRYDSPPVGTNDTSVTGWMIFAIKAAEDAGLDIDEGAYDGAMAWLEEVTDPQTGRVGYNEFGSRSSRITGVNDHFPSERGEAMTAVGLLSRVFMGQSDPDQHPILDKHAELMLRTLPEWDEDGFGNDMYYWYYGTYAMYQLGGKHWKRWEDALKPTIIETQRTDGDAKGSWDPVGPWGFAGGRVYSTAMMALTTEVYFRYDRVAGSR